MRNIEIRTHDKEGNLIDLKALNVAIKHDREVLEHEWELPPHKPRDIWFWVLGLAILEILCCYLLYKVTR
jgi:hypothetical protein